MDAGANVRGAAVIFAVFAVMPASSEAGSFYNGNELYAACQGALTIPSHYLGGICDGYIAAVADAIDMYQATAPQRLVCKPSQVTLGQTKAVVIKYLSDAPEVRHMAADELVWQALRKAFPCKG